MYNDCMSELKYCKFFHLYVYEIDSIESDWSLSETSPFEIESDEEFPDDHSDVSDCSYCNLLETFIFDTE
jgi:hypothetical protein